MHMADGFISPAVGCTMWAASAAITTLCARKVRQEKEMRLVPLMGVLGAFIFACQMLNFTIPGTGSSGHLGGGLILAVLLGPYAGFLVMAAILTVQALFFADGGLLALGCNIFNMGFFSCLVAYPFIYRPLAGTKTGTGRITLASVIAAVIGLQMGAFSVVLETTASGISALPFAQFVELMLPIHLAIGTVEGLATAAVVIFISKAQPSLLRPADLETGTVKKASILSMYSGADFIKTSTGKQQPAATPEAALVMCQAIKEYHELTGIKVGFKPAGGINCVNDALIYYTIVKEVLGEEWLNNELFRLGTSRLANLLLSEIKGEEMKFF